MTLVVKIGGNGVMKPQDVLEDIAELTEEGEKIVLIHGGSTAVDETLGELGKEPEYVETPSGVVGRFTDEETMEVFKMVMPGRLNTDITTSLRNLGVNAVGLSGVDGGLLTGKRKSAVKVVENGKRKIKRGDHSGRITAVNTDLLTTLLESGYTPVVTPPILADDGTAVNADADRVAGAVAGALGAELVILTDVPGVLKEIGNEDSVIGLVDTPAKLKEAKKAAEGFMTKKIMAVEEAFELGVKKAVVGSANTNNPVLVALDGGGTTFTPDAFAKPNGEEKRKEVTHQ